ncbi:hypothetical protein M2650_11285 [Luteimonas sp. SX5]|uniref:Uncharacterized protein n=1 Tax=Luteimonas galliterrae TaxID=2940486 RepID=A0ABT0MJZ6_9GAMM|nr:hypothetical protein [Luteimonas galliterrae]MCL1635207.1 hypothetical protein [Luteimonas galliterrae]
MNLSRARLAIAACLLLSACQRTPDAAAPAQPAVPEPAAADSVPPPAPAEPAGTGEKTAAYVLPGDFDAGTGLADLQARFGEANVRTGEVPGAEGETVSGIVLFPDDPKRRAYLYFDDEKALAGLNLVRAFDHETQWSLDNGLRIGTPLKEVVAMNGKPIKYYGLDWDYGGTVTSFNGGKLEPPPDAPVKRIIQLGSNSTADNPQPDDAYPIGDSEFSSDDPAYPRQGDYVIVGEIAVSFPGKQDN